MPGLNFSDYNSRPDSMSGVGLDAFAITPHDVTNFTKPCRAVYVGTGGDLTLVTISGAVTFVGVASGSLIPVFCTRVNFTGTTADDLVGLV